MLTAISLYDRLKTRLGEESPDGIIREKAEIAEEILRLKREKNALILVHNYIDPALFHTIPDITGDSLELSRRASETDSDIILVCGVSFMAETAKLLNPEKKVLLPVAAAGCSLAESITVEDIRALKSRHPGAPVVTYINTYAEVKAETDICCTSGNAAEVLRSLNHHKIIFLPDEFLGANIAQATGKEIIFPGQKGEGQLLGWRGRCEVHEKFSLSQVERIRRDHPAAVILAHPECPPEVINAVDFSGGTTALIDHIQKSDAREFCLLSEAAMEKNILLEDSRKRFIPIPPLRCPHMEKITLENTLEALRQERYEVEVPEEIRGGAAEAVRRMLRLGPRG